MSRNGNAAVLFGLCVGLTACDPAPDGDLTEPESKPEPAAAASRTQPTATAASYSTTFLNTRFGIAQDVNNKGQVVGFYATPDFETHAFLWESGIFKDLGTLGGTYSEAFAINAAGQVVGESSNVDEEIHAFLWENGVMRDLGTLGWTGPAGGPASTAAGINALGQVTGWSLTAAGAVRAFLWDNGTMKRLAGLEKTVGKGNGIDNSARVVGELNGPHAFRWVNGVVRSLGSLGGRTSTALDINGEGKIVGNAATQAGSLHGFVWRNGVMTDLGTLGGANSGATAINSLGQIVGESELASGPGHAFIWENGVMKDVGPGTANGINANGWIVGARTWPTADRHLGLLPTLWKPSDAPPPPPVPSTVDVTLGTTFFFSNRNGTTDMAIDTVAVGGTVTWTWVSGTGVQHSVHSLGTPSFQSSDVMGGAGTRYSVTFTQAGTYRYDCILHHRGMQGTVVVK